VTQNRSVAVQKENGYEHYDGLEKGEEEIFPDPASQSIAESWRAGVSKALERQFAAFMPQSVTA
jgi:hypothetical protein